jgi:hypothetical protein
MFSSEISPVNPVDLDDPEEPSERATLTIRSKPVDLTVSAQGAATMTLTLGVIGPVGTIAIGHYAGFPVWAIVIVCALQIIALILRRTT